MEVSNDIKYIGVNDHSIDLFEGLYQVPRGISYNSYVILDEKIAVLDTVDGAFVEQWMDNMEKAVGSAAPDYLIVQHMEPDHSAGIVCLAEKYPEMMIVASIKAFAMMEHFFGQDFSDRRMVVGDEDILSLGRHKLVLLSALMVHWPEVVVTYDSAEKCLFSADAFGTFGALDDLQAEGERNKAECEAWAEEASRYYFGIVGKYGISVQKLLQKLAHREIKAICPLHGPILSENIGDYMERYHTWSSYQPEKKGVLIAYASIYGNTRKAAELLAEKLMAKGVKCVEVRDVARCDKYEAIAQAFRCDRLVLASPTYNTGVFPPIREFVQELMERNFSNRTIAFIENGSWMPTPAKILREKLEQCKGMVFLETSVKIMSALNAESIEELEILAYELYQLENCRRTENEICM